MRAALEPAAAGDDASLKAEAIAIADVTRVADGPLVSVRGVRPPELSYSGPAESLLPPPALEFFTSLPGAVGVTGDASSPRPRRP